MKKALLILIETFILNFAYSQKFDWTITLEGGSSYANRVKSGPDEAVICGAFSDTVDFDPDTTDYKLISNVVSQPFFAKYSASGSLMWAMSLDVSTYAIPGDMVIDRFKNIYIIGRFRDSIDLDPGPLVANFASNGQEDVFVAKYDEFGQFILGFSIGSIVGDVGYAIDLDSAGNIYISGRFSSTVDFDPGVGVNSLIGTLDIFLAKYDATGSFLWVIKMGGAYLDEPADLIISRNEGIILVGTFQDQANFNPIGTALLNSAGNTDIFIAKYSLNGLYRWAKKIGGIDLDRPAEISIDTASDIYITGSFSGTVDFDPGSSSVTRTSFGDWDIFIAKFDSIGNYKWVLNYGGSDFEAGSSIKVQDTLLYSCGVFTSTVNFNSQDSDYIFTSQNSFRDLFFSKSNYHGKHKVTRAIGDLINDEASSLDLDVNGNLYITGLTNLQPDFDPGCNTSYRPYLNHYATFLMKFSPCDKVYFIHDSVSSCSNAMYYFPDGDSSNVSVTDTSCLSAMDGCDSTIITKLYIRDVDIGVNDSNGTMYAEAINATYQWLKCTLSGYMVLSGETHRSFKPASNGSYAVVVTQNGCTDTSACFEVVDIGLDFVGSKSGIYAYPNPNTGMVTVELGQKYMSAQFVLMDSKGSVVRNWSFEQVDKVFLVFPDKGDLYLLNIIVGDQKTMLRIIRN